MEMGVWWYPAVMSITPNTVDLRLPMRWSISVTLGIGQPSLPMVLLLRRTKSRQKRQSFEAGLGTMWTLLYSCAGQGLITPSSKYLFTCFAISFCFSWLCGRGGPRFELVCHVTGLTFISIGGTSAACERTHSEKMSEKSSQSLRIFRWVDRVPSIVILSVGFESSGGKKFASNGLSGQSTWSRSGSQFPRSSIFDFTVPPIKQSCCRVTGVGCTSPFTLRQSSITTEIAANTCEAETE